MQAIDIHNPTGITGDDPVPAVIRWPSGSPESPNAELSTALRVRRVETETELSAIAGDWNRLAGDVPFRQFEWLESWWRHYRRDGWRLYTLVVTDASGRTVAIAPWYVSQSAAKGSIVQFLGSGEVCSEYLTVLTDEGRDSAVAAALADWLTTEGADDWDLLLLEAANADDSTVLALSAEFTNREHTVHERPGIACWRTELPNDWNEFLQGLSKSRRDRVRKLIRQNFDTGRAQNFSATTAAEFERGFQILVDLHQRRRGSLGQAGRFADPRFAAFHAEVSGRFEALGKLRLVWTELEGRPVAAEYDFVGGRTVYYYQTGLEPDAIDENPGWLGLAGSLRRAVGEGYTTFDFLRGDEAYKSSWGAQPKPTTETRIVARHPAARLRHAAWLARQQLRDWAKRGFRRAGNTRGTRDM